MDKEEYTLRLVQSLRATAKHANPDWSRLAVYVWIPGESGVLLTSLETPAGVDFGEWLAPERDNLLGHLSAWQQELSGEGKPPFDGIFVTALRETGDFSIFFVYAKDADRAEWDPSTNAPDDLMHRAFARTERR